MSPKTIYLSIIIVSITLVASAKCNICGKWDAGRGGIIEIYENGDKLYGKLVESQDPNRIDTENPDKALRNEKLVGHNILIGFQQAKDLTWKNGKIYNPDNGELYDAKITLKNEVLKIRGFVGIALFGKTVKWSRVTDSISQNP